MSGRNEHHTNGYREAIKWAITWLHERAGTMNDEHARAILNSAAFSMGIASKKPTPPVPAADVLYARFVPEFGSMQMCGKSDLNAVEYRPVPAAEAREAGLRADVTERCAQIVTAEADKTRSTRPGRSIALDQIAEQIRARATLSPETQVEP